MLLRSVAERLTLWLLLVLALLGGFALFALIATETMHWAIFSRLGDSLFKLALPACALAVVVLALFNLALNAGLLVQRQLLAPAGEPQSSEAGVGQPSPAAQEQHVMTLVRRVLLVLAGGALLLGVVLYLLNRGHIADKMTLVESEMKAFVKDAQPALERTAARIGARREAEAIAASLKTLSSTTPFFRGLRFLIPLQHEGRTVFKDINGWQRDTHRLFEVEGLYAPNRFELAYLRRALGETGPAKPQLFVRRPQIKVLYPVRDTGGRTVFFLLSDGHSYAAREHK